MRNSVGTPILLGQYGLKYDNAPLYVWDKLYQKERASLVTESGKSNVVGLQSYKVNKNFEFPASDDAPPRTPPIKHLHYSSFLLGL